MVISRRVVLSVGVAALVAQPAFAQGEGGPPLPPALGALSPTALTTPDGTPTTLGAHLRPGPAVISFWATWCGPCVMEARHLARLRTRFAAERLNIIGINIDRRRDEARIAQFLERNRVNYTQLRADIDAYRAFNNGEQILLPRLYVFAADGAPVAAFGRYHGGATLRAVDRAVEGVLAV
jgi:thiol-disulfide isomerase/thioredoxin